MRRVVTANRLLTAGLALLAIVLALIVWPSNDYIFLPDPAHPVAPLVTVPGGKEPKTGGIYYVDVVVRKAKLLEKLFGGLHEGADLYPASAINPPGVNDARRRQIDLEDMQNSQRVAAAVALRADGNKKVVMRSVGAKVTEVVTGEPAVGKLQPDDVITAIDGSRIKDPHDVYVAMSKHKPGDTVAFTIRRGKQTLVEHIKTVASPQPPKRPVVGIVIETALDIHLPIAISIDAGGVGGPSAGLAFALDVLQELGRNVTRGHKIAATGEILPNGGVGEIGGIKQKTIGARRAHVDAFLVPVENASDARRYAKGLRIIPVETFQQALHALATLR